MDIFAGHLSFPGLLNFGKFDSLSYELFELMIFVLIGAAGGIFGALFNHLNFKLAVFRTRYCKNKVKKEKYSFSSFNVKKREIHHRFITFCQNIRRETDKIRYP